METIQTQAPTPKPQRSAIGKIFKWTFILFNILMLYWFIVGVGGAASTINDSQSEAERAGGTIGTGLGAIFIIFIWVAGDVILGMFTYFTRAKR